MVPSINCVKLLDRIINFFPKATKYKENRSYLTMVHACVNIYLFVILISRSNKS